MKEFSTVSVVGLGYIGLPTAVAFASRKIRVSGVDIDPRAVDAVNRGEIHIVEPDLEAMVKMAVDEGYLSAFGEPQSADAHMIAVPTPFTSKNYEPDLSYIRSASRAVAKVLKKGDLIVLESTSPVGATEQMANWMAAERPDLTFPHTHGESSDIRVAYCPERVLPGHIMRELVENDRVIGGMTPSCSQAAVDLYRTFVNGDCAVTNSRTAEMVKLTENSFRDVNIAFANELSMICDELGIDVKELISLASRHPRVNILQPGPGVGGHCIAVDPWFIVSKTPRIARLIRTARQVNDSKPGWVLGKIEDTIGKFLLNNPDRTASSVKIACYGLAFKPDIDDLRESPALQIVKSLAEKHAGEVIAVEPNISELQSSEVFSLVTLEEAGSSADIHVMLVAHKEFKTGSVMNMMDISVV